MTWFQRYYELRDQSRILRDGLRQRGDAALSVLESLSQNGPFRLLDIGCADGRMLQIFAHRFPQCQFIGLDASLELVNVARRLRLNTVKGLAESLPFDAGRFNVITLIATLKHVRDYTAVLNECRRVLVRRGSLLLSDPTPFAIRMGIRLGHFDPRYLPNVWSLRVARRHLEELGFEVVSSWRYMPAPISLPGSRTLEKALRAAGLSSLFMQQIIHAMDTESCPTGGRRA